MNGISTATSPWPAPWTSRNSTGRTCSSSRCPPRSMWAAWKIISPRARCSRLKGGCFRSAWTICPIVLGSKAPPVGTWRRTHFQAMRAAADGDVLIFMPGGYEISRTIEAIRHRPESQGVPSSSAAWRIAAARSGCGGGALRSAESCGRDECRRNLHHHRRCAAGDRLRARADCRATIRIVGSTPCGWNDKPSSAEQRAGRAGRTAPGHCFRLWSRPEQEERPQQDLPEIKRLDLSEVILTLKAGGIEDLREFRWLEAPARPPEPCRGVVARSGSPGE